MELSRRLGKAHEAGIAVACAALPGVGDAGLHAAADLLAAQQIQAVWSPRCSAHGSTVNRPVPLRDGLWHLPATAEISPPRGWLATAKQRAEQRRAIRHVAETRGMLHLWVDAATIGAAGDLAVIERALQTAADAQRDGKVRIGTVSKAAQWLAASPKATPLHSVLRAA